MYFTMFIVPRLISLFRTYSKLLEHFSKSKLFIEAKPLREKNVFIDTSIFFLVIFLKRTQYLNLTTHTNIFQLFRVFSYIGFIGDIMSTTRYRLVEQQPYLQIFLLLRLYESSTNHQATIIPKAMLLGYL